MPRRRPITRTGPKGGKYVIVRGKKRYIPRGSAARDTKYERCVRSVRVKGGNDYNPWAVCTASLRRKYGNRYKIVR